MLYLFHLSPLGLYALHPCSEGTGLSMAAPQQGSPQQAPFMLCQLSSTHAPGGKGLPGDDMAHVAQHDAQLGSVAGVSPHFRKGLWKRQLSLSQSQLAQSMLYPICILYLLPMACWRGTCSQQRATRKQMQAAS